MGALADHLWQSTWFALAAALLALLVRRDAARIRYWIWFAASLKFLVPFSVLTWIGSQFIFQVTDEDALLPLVRNVAAPLTDAAVVIDPITDERKDVFIVIWMLGAFAIAARWLSHWWHARGLAIRSVPCDIRAATPVHESNEVAEPCVIGILDPVLLLPASLTSQLPAEHLESIIAHETCHVRRRDNLTATLHAVVTALFWFHPLVWWLGAKLIETREHACDEGAIAEGHEPRVYAEAILGVCRYSVQSRVECVARASGGDLTSRIRTILSGPSRPRLLQLRRAIAAFALLSSVALPVAAGMNVVSIAHIQVAAGTQSLRLSEQSGPAFINADDDHVYARNVSIRELIAHAYEVKPHDVMGPRGWLDNPRYDLDLRSADGAHDARQLVAEFLERQFNLELTVRPTVSAQHR